MGMAEGDAEFSEGFNSEQEDVFQNIKWQGSAMYRILEGKFQAWKPHSCDLTWGKGKAYVNNGGLLYSPTGLMGSSNLKFLL